MLRCGERAKSESALHFKMLRSSVIAMIMREIFVLIWVACSVDFCCSGPRQSVCSHLLDSGPRDPLTFIGSAIVLIFAAGLTRLPQAVSIHNRTPYE